VKKTDSRYVGVAMLITHSSHHIRFPWSNRGRLVNYFRDLVKACIVINLLSPALLVELIDPNSKGFDVTRLVIVRVSP
jgi:hypothetical protein